mgnify:FL=1
MTSVLFSFMRVNHPSRCATVPSIWPRNNDQPLSLHTIYVHYKRRKQGHYWCQALLVSDLEHKTNNILSLLTYYPNEP